MEENERLDWKSLARETGKWMKEIGAVHNYETKERSYITRADWVEAFGSLYEIDEEEWAYCLRNMFEQKIYVGFAAGKGFYLCNAFDSATTLTRLINYSSSLQMTINLYIASMERGGGWPEIAPGMKGRIRISDVRQLTTSMEAMGVLVDEPVKQALEDAQRLLTTAAENHGR